MILQWLEQSTAALTRIVSHCVYLCRRQWAQYFVAWWTKKEPKRLAAIWVITSVKQLDIWTKREFFPDSFNLLCAKCFECVLGDKMEWKQTPWQMTIHLPTFLPLYYFYHPSPVYSHSAESAFHLIKLVKWRSRWHQIDFSRRVSKETNAF